MHALLLLSDLGLALLHGIGAVLEALTWLLEPLEVISWLGERFWPGSARRRRGSGEPPAGIRHARRGTTGRHTRRRRRAARGLRSA